MVGSVFEVVLFCVAMDEQDVASVAPRGGMDISVVAMLEKGRFITEVSIAWVVVVCIEKIGGDDDLICRHRGGLRRLLRLTVKGKIIRITSY